MPALGSNGRAGGPTSNPKYAPPKPPPPSGGFLGNIGAAVQHAAPAVTHAATSAATPHHAATPGSDIQSSGAGYGSARANQYKQTPAYHQTVAQVFRAQPPVQKAAIISGLSRQNAFNTPEYQAVRGQWDHLSIPEQNVIQKLVPHDLPKFIAPKSDLNLNPIHLADQGLKSLGNALGALQAIGPQGPEGRISQSGLAAPGLGKIATHAPIDVARATLQDPSVIPKTAKGLADSVAGMVAGTVQLPIRMVQQGPGPAISQLGRQIGQDYSRRYGPLTQGNDQAFINRIKQEGAAPEIFDAAALVGGADATAGRAVSSLARTKAALSGKENFLTRPRSDLLLSGSKTRPQQLAPTAGRASAQRLEDFLRSKRKGELTPAAHQVAPIFQSHAIRVVHSGVAQKWRRVIQENLGREVRGHMSSANHAIGKLNDWQRQAVYHAIHGIRMDTPANLKADLAARRAQIVADRTNPASLGNRIPAQHADKVDELKLIDQLSAHADKIAGPKMVAFQKGEAARAQRIEGMTNLHPATAEARRLRSTGDRLGIEHPDVAQARVEAAAVNTAKQAKADARTAPRASSAPASGAQMPGRPSFGGDLVATRTAGKVETLSQLPRTERLAQYVRQVRAEMTKRGLPEPGYFKHVERPETKFGDYAAGQGAKAMPGDKVSTWALHRAGVADTSPQAYLNGLARSVKRPFQWRLTDEQFRHAALPTPTRVEIKAALGHEKAPHLLTGNELRRVLEHRGVDLKNVSFYNPGRLAERTLADHSLLPKTGPAPRGLVARAKATEAKGRNQIVEPNQLESQDLHHALQQDDAVQHGTGKLGDKFLTTPGWKAIPRTAFDEIHGNLKASSLGGRLVGKVQGTTAGVILGQNPHFLIMNTLAHAIPAIAGTKGGILSDLAKFPVWWHSLSDAQKDTIRGYSGGRGGHYNATARLGSQAPNQIAAFGRRLDERGLVQAAKAVNPLHAVMRGEDIQSNFFRHAVMYHELKRAAFQDMSHEYSRAVAQWEQVKHVFSLGPQDRMRAIMQDMTKLEDLGRTTVNILGDYGRFTNRERTFLNNRAIMFYSFLRHVTRTLLYVLPARHPLAFGLLGELGNLHVEEVKQLMGGQDLPWAYGRMFFESNGKLKSIDMMSTSPISSPLVDILGGGVKQVGRLISPALAPLLDIVYGQTPTGGKVQQNAWTYLNDLFSLSYPYRQGAAIHHGLKPQQSDSIPLIHERPQNFKTASSQDYQAAKTQARGPLKDYLLGSALGVYPKPDDSQVIAQHMAAKAKGKAGASGNWWGGGAAKAGASGSWWGGSGSSSSAGASGAWWK